MIYVIKPTSRRVGNTTAARMFIETLLGQGRLVAIADSNQGNPALAHLFGGSPRVRVNSVNLSRADTFEKFATWLRLINAECDDFDVVIDMDLATSLHIDNDNDPLFWLRRELGQRIAICHCIGPTKEDAGVLAHSITVGIGAYVDSAARNIALKPGWINDDFAWENHAVRDWSDEWGMANETAPNLRMPDIRAALFDQKMQRLAIVSGELSQFSAAYLNRWIVDYARSIGRIIPSRKPSKLFAPRS